MGTMQDIKDMTHQMSSLCDEIDYSNNEDFIVDEELEDFKGV